MPLSDFYPEMQGWQPADTPDTKPQPASSTPIGPSQSPTVETPSSPYLRAPLPLPLQYAPDTLRQYNRPGLSSFRIAPIPPNGVPSINSAATSVVKTTVVETINSSAAGPNGAIQFNNAGLLGGVNLLEWNQISAILSVIGSVTISTPLGVASGGTGSNLSATGGASEVLLQTTVGGAITVRQLTYADISGSPTIAIWNTTVQTSTYTAVAKDMVLANTSGGGFTVTLPLSSANKNLSIRVKKTSSDSNTVTVGVSGSDLIDGQSTQTFNSQYTDLEAIADGSGNWWIA
jgi:hypothetical protein